MLNDVVRFDVVGLFQKVCTIRFDSINSILINFDSIRFDEFDSLNPAGSATDPWSVFETEKHVPALM